MKGSNKSIEPPAVGSLGLVQAKARRDDSKRNIEQLGSNVPGVTLFLTASSTPSS
jgi:hypothetical protein